MEYLSKYGLYFVYFSVICRSTALNFSSFSAAETEKIQPAAAARPGIGDAPVGDGAEAERIQTGKTAPPIQGSSEKRKHQKCRMEGRILRFRNGLLRPDCLFSQMAAFGKDPPMQKSASF